MCTSGQLLKVDTTYSSLVIKANNQMLTRQTDIHKPELI